MEEWRQVEGFKNYYVSNMGRVYNVFTKRFVGNKYSEKYPYKRVKLSEGRKKKPIDVHRLVAETFISNPKHCKVVNHKNGIQSDNRVENLEWCSYSENQIHALNIGLAKPPFYENKLSKEEIEYIRKNYKHHDRKYGQNALARKFGVHHSTIQKYLGKKR